MRTARATYLSCSTTCFSACDVAGMHSRSLSLAAAAHGNVRFAQGYSPSMLVEESRIFQVSTFSTLHLHQSELDQSEVLLDVMTIADEADRQLTETVRSFMTAQQAAAA